MRSNALFRTVMLLVAVGMAIPAGSIIYVPPDPDPPAIPDWPPWRGDPPNTPGGLCTLCAMVSCGCAPAPPGSYLIFSCDCTGGNCRNTCDYEAQW